MTPLTQDPNVVIRINPNTLEVVDIASNVAADLRIKIVTTATEYGNEAANKPFDTLRLPGTLN